MRQKRFACITVLVALALVAGACSDTQKTSTGSPTNTSKPNAAMAGTYTCAPDPRPTDPNWGGPETWVLSADGKLTTSSASGAKTEGKWGVDQNQIVVRIDGGEDRFNIDGTRFVAPGTHPAGGKFTCTPSGTTASPGSTALAGKYNCLQPRSTEPDIIEMETDGDLFITQGGQRNGPGKWTASGNSGKFNPGTPNEDSFTVQDGKLVFGDGTTCTRTS